jgi:ABC-type sugar transport system permease subunit
MARPESTQDRGAARLAAGPAAAGASPKQRSTRRKRIELTVLLGPPLVLFIGFVFVPMIFAIWYSLYNWNGYGPLSDFIGLQNYQGVLTGSVFHQALLHNIIIAVLSVVIQLPISIGLALLLAGLQGVPPELREAAAIDGATSWQITRRIMLPLLGPTIRIWIFLAVIGSLQLFDIVWIMTLGGPANASQTMLTYLYFNGAERTQFGYGATVSVVLFVISFVFALAYQRYALRRDTAGALTRAVG